LVRVRANKDCTPYAKSQSQEIIHLTDLIYCERHDGVILLKSGLVSQILEAVAAQPVVSVCIKETGSRDTITFALPVQRGSWVKREITLQVPTYIVLKRQSSLF
jgi:hypothetical protein